jgi:hypothetical protein
VAVGIRQSRQIGIAVVAVIRRVMRRVGMVRLDHRLELIGGIVRILHHLPRLIGHARQIARTIVGVLRGRRILVGRLQGKDSKSEKARTVIGALSEPRDVEDVETIVTAWQASWPVCACAFAVQRIPAQQPSGDFVVSFRSHRPA